MLLQLEEYVMVFVKRSTQQNKHEERRREQAVPAGRLDTLCRQDKTSFKLRCRKDLHRSSSRNRAKPSAAEAVNGRIPSPNRASHTFVYRENKIWIGNEMEGEGTVGA